MFLDFYGLREQPFGVTPDPGYLYLSRTHREALAALLYGIKADRGFMALIAESGMGKTTFCIDSWRKYTILRARYFYSRPNVILVNFSATPQ